MNLWSALLDRTDHALTCGALAPIETEAETIEAAGVRFVVRRVSSLARKAAQQAAASAQVPRTGPVAFPVEHDLTVAEISPTHIALLNKFPVIPHHLLLVTRRFVPQEALLDLADFEALAPCMADYEALGFYNGGRGAGASQPHKHLQVVPLPLGVGDAVPMAALFDSVPRAPRIANVPRLPFRHAFSWLGAVSGDRLLQAYLALLSAAGINAVRRDGGVFQSGPYNLLVTRDWMLLVPRSREDVEGISINALGFAGSIFVKSPLELNRVREAGPMTMLASVGVA
jgi:ATP adenylyltransferase